MPRRLPPPACRPPAHVAEASRQLRAVTRLGEAADRLGTLSRRWRGAGALDREARSALSRATRVALRRMVPIDAAMQAVLGPLLSEAAVSQAPDLAAADDAELATRLGAGAAEAARQVGALQRRMLDDAATLVAYRPVRPPP